MQRLAVLIIDMLNDFFRLNPALAAQRQQLTAATNRVIDAARESGHPVIWVRQEFSPDLSDSFLQMRRDGTRITVKDTEGCEVLPELHRATTDKTVVKKRYSAFFGTDLDEHLGSLKPEVLFVCGINTHACIRTTVIDAYQRDYDVVIAAECVGLYDPAHHEITMRYLGSGIARIASNADILQRFANG